MHIISAEQIRAVINWEGVLNALQRGHMGPRPQGDGYFIGDADFGLFSRGVILPGQGAGVKIASICPANSAATPQRPTEQAAFIVIDEHSKGIAALLDGPEITRWKTAADSALAARYLSRTDSKVLLVLGAGPVARSLTDAYLHIRPAIEKVLLWNRTPERLNAACAALRQRNIEVEIVSDLDAAVSQADIIGAATSACAPMIKGRLIKPGTHIDLIGGYRPDMQEADCETFRQARVFVDDRNNALQAGDLLAPIEAGIMQASDIEADLFELCQHPDFQHDAPQRTIYKNAGGAHLDLLASQYVLEQVMLTQA